MTSTFRSSRDGALRAMDRLALEIHRRVWWIRDGDGRPRHESADQGINLFCHPPRCRLLHVARDGPDTLNVAAEGRRDHACCPVCRTRSSAVHSRTQRRPANLSTGGKVFRLQLTIRRLTCHHPGCPCRTFVERFPHLLGAQRTRRFAEAHARTGLALGGQPAARLLSHLCMPASAATLLRTIYQLPLPSSGGPHVVGVDDWTLRNGRTYGTIVIDPASPVPARPGGHGQGALGVRAGAPAAQGGPWPRPLRGPLLDRTAPTRADDVRGLRLPPAPAPRRAASDGAGEK